MSHNQSRSDKSETAQYRKTGRSSSYGQQRGSSGQAGWGKGGVGGGRGVGGATGPPPINSLPSNRSFKKSSNNALGVQATVSGSGLISESSNASAVPRRIQDGSHARPPLHGSLDAPAASASARPTDSSIQKGTQPDPKTPSSDANAALISSDKMASTTPAKGDGSRGYTFQFGSLNMDALDGMQMPARTSSAPPNLDEQKRDQIPSVSKQQLPRKDAGVADQSSSGEAHPLSKAKRVTQFSSVPTATQTPNSSVHSMSRMPAQMPFHQSQVSVQFGGPNTQIQPPSMTLPTPMSLPIGGTPQVQQQMFVSGLQHHSMPTQGIMPQGQGMSFTTQMGPSLGPQLGNQGISITSQYPQQQSGNYGSARKPVKIIDPKTHEELRLDKQAETYLDGGASGLRSHSNPPQSHPIPTFSLAPMNYYTNSYNSNLLFSASSLPPMSSHVARGPRAPRFSYQVSQASQTVPLMNSSALNSLSANNSGNPIHGISDSVNMAPAVDTSILSPTMQITVKPAAAFVGEKVGSISLLTVEKPDLRKSGEDSLSNLQRDYVNYSESSQQRLKPGREFLAPESLPVASKQTALVSVSIPVETSASNMISSAPSAVCKESPAVVINEEAIRNEFLSRPNSIKDHQNKQSNKGHLQAHHQVSGLPSSISSLPSTDQGHGVSVNGDFESVEAKSMLTPIEASKVILESSEPLAVHAVISESKIDRVGTDSKLYEVSITGNDDETVKTVCYVRQDGFSQDEHLKYATVKAAEQKDAKFPEGPKDCGELSSDSKSSKSFDISKQIEKEPALSITGINNEVSSLETVEGKFKKLVGFVKDDKLNRNLVVFTATTADSIHSETDPCIIVSSTISEVDINSSLDASLSRNNSMCSTEIAVVKSSIPDQDLATVLTTFSSEATLKHEVESAENISSGQAPFPITGSKDKLAPELSRSKSLVTKGKKKRKEMFQKADAAGTTSDLYIAYKGPEDKKETAISSESMEDPSSCKQVSADVAQEDALPSEGGAQSKTEPDDWEDAADISTPKLEASNNRGQAHGVINHNEDGLGVMGKKYSRDFLLKFSDQCIILPDKFDVTPDIMALMVANVNPSHDRESFPGRIVDKPSGGSRLERRGSGVVDDDKWRQGAFASGRDVRLEIGSGGNVLGLRPGQGGNYVSGLRNPRAQASVQYAGGILSGPVRSLGPQGGMQRYSSDADRWERATGFQKGLIPSPQTPLQVMHKAEKKYEVGKVTDEEEAKQRQLKAILNKLTPQNFEKLFEQVKAVNIDNAVTLTGIISQIFDKALMEPTFCEMYANFCSDLAVELPNFSEDNEKITFKRLLLNKCQEEFERGEREQEEANRVEEEGEIKQTKEEREEKRMKARRQMLGNIRLIGELYKKRMLTERIMHECIKKLLCQFQIPEEEDIEALCKLMSTIGEMIDHPKAKEHMDAYFERMADLTNNMKLSSRVRFMLKDSIDLRKNKWQQRRKIEGPKKIEDVHRDAAQERQAQVSRLARGAAIIPSPRRTVDFGPRGSNMVPSSNSQVGGYRGFPTHDRGLSTHGRGFGTQDVRLDDRHPYEGRPLSSLPQRPIGDDAITLGPQGGLAKGMSIRGQPPISNICVADMPSSSGDSRRRMSSLNGYSSIPERTGYSTKEDAVPRYMPEKIAHDQLNIQQHNLSFGSIRNPDPSLDRSLPCSNATQVPALVSTHNVASEKVWPEECLREISIATIKEFYSAKDEKEVALCFKDLNSPSLYPAMISIWVTDSFERKDVERDLLAKLLVKLTKSQDAMLSQLQLIKGFEVVLTTLEDAVNDAPRAAEFLGHIFAKVILENVISLREVGRLIYNGGEEQGNLRQVGLAAELLGTTLEMIKSEKGDSVLNDIRTSSSLRLEDFRHPDPYRSRKLQVFI